MSKLQPNHINDPLIIKYRARFDDSPCREPFTYEEARELFNAYVKLSERLTKIARISDKYQTQIKNLVLELQDALANVKTLKGLLPICACCKKIRSDDGFWKNLEQYISKHSDAHFSHGICPDCARNYYALARIPHAETEKAPAERAHMLDESDLDDPVIVRFLPTLNNPHYRESPLYGELTTLFQKYVRLTKRMKRIVRISDSYQSQLHELKTQLEAASNTDYLTGLYNRRAMYEHLETELSRSRRHGRQFALAMMDFDRFKQINDSHGHEIGDRILVTAARIVNESLRKEDTCARWGGEEFLLLFPEANAECALAIAERLRKLIAGISIDTPETTVRITASLGVSLYRKNETLSDCIKRADEALYQAKNAGRDRSVLLG